MGRSNPAGKRTWTVEHGAGQGPVVPARTPSAAGAPTAFRHGAAVVDGDRDLLAAALPYLTEGLRAGDLVALTCPGETVELLRAELGADRDRVVSDPSLSLLGARGPDAFSCTRDYLVRAADSPSGRLRVLASVDFGNAPAGWREGQRFESLCNRYMETAAVSALCVYDRRRLPQPVVDSAAATHPALLRSGSWTANPGFQEPTRYVSSLPEPREPAEELEPLLAVEDASSLFWLRHRIADALAGVVPRREQLEDLQLATSEVAANAFRHGRRPVSARLWAAGGRVVCSITDSGPGFSDPFAGYRPAHGEDLGRGGMGLWLARKLWDCVDLLPGPDGFSVRLSTRLH